jgi:dipeptidyl aminopeptidase/acylaminoacyl peptidase
MRLLVLLLVGVNPLFAQAPRERLNVPPHAPRAYNERLPVQWASDGRSLTLRLEQPLGRVPQQIALAGTPALASPPTQFRWPHLVNTPWTAPVGDRALVIHDHNVGVRIDAGLVTMLTTDGRADRSYNRAFWSPDGRYAVVCRQRLPEGRTVHTLESAPAAGGRAKLHTRVYPLPGDPFPEYELHAFDMSAAKEIRLEAPVVDFGDVRLRWGRDGHSFVYVKRERGHQRFRLIEVDLRTGHSRALIDEQSPTFIWSYGYIGLDDALFTWIDTTDEIVYLSERSGWRHLYLVDGRVGRVLHPITTGDWVVRQVDFIDPERREIGFAAGGREPGHDPYWLHHYRINFDGSGLVRLTDGLGTHSVQYSPERRYLVDTWSRVDLPPVHVLRDGRTGEPIRTLATADIGELRLTGWTAPEPFVAKGRDGVTDIHGIICRPPNFDPRQRYPVIEHIYAGPHSAHVPKAFRPYRHFSELTDLGFVVVQIDGMGTAHRSKAFHDVCWHNLKDAGFPDRIAWHRAVAARYPWYDLRRVGIYGTSAGGQNALGALLFHGDFYQAAMAACGCHDNRMDKASWNEQWMGYPVGPHYAASSNVEHAHRLRGQLLLIVGELDTNVPPESTYRVVDALIKAGKDFELVVIPGLGHSNGGAYGTRRMQDFFVRHLLHHEPPNRNR